MRKSRFLLWVALLCGAPSLNSQQVFHDLTGQSGEDGFGYAVGTAGDQDGDGYDDVFVGRPGALTSSASVYSGFDGSLLQRFPGDAESGFGTALANLGDLDGDGRDELAVGSPFLLSGAGFDGAVFVYSGGGALLYSVASSNLAADPNPRFGSALAPIDDLDGDGLRELLVGAPWEPADGVHRSAVWVLSGADGTLLRRIDGATQVDGFGRAVAAIGDVNGDGAADILVGAAQDDAQGIAAGRVDLYSGTDGGLLLSVVGPGPGVHFGQAVTASVDLDADTLPDFAVAADDAVHLHSSATGTLLMQIPGRAAALAQVSDVDHDGFTDIACADPSGGAANAGVVRVISVRTGASLQEFFGDAPGDRLGTALAHAGEVNGDDHSDLVAGAPGSDLNGTDGGLARVYSGVPFRTTTLHAVAGERGAARGHHLRPLHPTGLWGSLSGPGSTYAPEFDLDLGLDSAVRLTPLDLSDGRGRILWIRWLPLALQGKRVWLQIAQDALVTDVFEVVIR